MIDPELIRNYKKLKWDKLLRTDLGQAGELLKADPIFKRIKKTFDFIIEHPATESLTDVATNQIDFRLQDFINFVSGNIMTFSDVSLRNTKIQEIKNKEWEITESLSSIIQYFLLHYENQNLNTSENDLEINQIRQEWEEQKNELNTLKSSVPIILNNLETSIDLANNLQNNSETIKKAINSASEWIQKNKETVDLILENNASNAAQKANEHITYQTKWVEIWLLKKFNILKKHNKQPSFHGSFVWIMSSMFFGLIVMLIIGHFVYSPGELTVGMALLRISAILVPSYFTVFSTQQYLAHRKLYESYRFKDVSLNTMIQLKKQISDNERGSQELIVKKTLDVLFSEPILKEDVKYDKQIILQLLEMIKK